MNQRSRQILLSGNIELIKAHFNQTTVSTISILEFVINEKVECSEKISEIFHHLVSNGADLHIHDDYLLRLACRKGLVKIVKFLLDYGLSVHIENEAALYIACGEANVVLIKELLLAGATFRKNALYDFCEYLVVLEMILNYGEKSHLHQEIVEKTLKKLIKKNNVLGVSKILDSPHINLPARPWQLFQFAVKNNCNYEMLMVLVSLPPDDTQRINITEEDVIRLARDKSDERIFHLLNDRFKLNINNIDRKLFIPRYNKYT